MLKLVLGNKAYFFVLEFPYHYTTKADGACDKKLGQETCKIIIFYLIVFFFIVITLLSWEIFSLVVWIIFHF